MSKELFPQLVSPHIKHFKILIVLAITLAISIFVFENKTAVLAFVGVSINELPIYSVETKDKVVSITFDSAWGTEDLDEILEILARHNCVATFFVEGNWAENYPDAITKIAEGGHLIGNHGANHKHMTKLSQAEMLAEIQGCHDIIKEQTGIDMTLFRAPYGDYNETVVESAKSLGYSTIQWDVDSLDWKDYGIESIIDTVCNHQNLKNGSIILLHNGSKYTALALDQMLTNLESQGYTFIGLDKLILTENYEIDHTGRQSKTGLAQ